MAQQPPPNNNNNNNNNNSNNNITPEKRPRPQYHYFYGSTTDTAATTVNPSNSSSPGGGDSTSSDPIVVGASTPLLSSPNTPGTGGVGSSTATDQDSLVGECLIQTDNEEEQTPNNSELDLQHLLISNGAGGIVDVLVAGTDSGTGRIATNINRLPPPHSRNSMSTKQQQEQHNGPNSSNSNNRRRRRRRPWYQTLSLEQLREEHPLVHFGCLVVAAALFGILLTAIFFPNSRLASLTTTPRSELSFRMPFPRVDRADYDDPVGPDNIMNLDLFDPALLNNKGETKASSSSGDSSNKRIFTFPFPTGAFWTNLVLQHTTSDRGLSFPIAVYPYAYKWSPHLMQVSYPHFHRRVEPKMIHDDFFPDLTLDSNETIAQRHVIHFDALSVTLRFHVESSNGNNHYRRKKEDSSSSASTAANAAAASGAGGAYWQTFLVQGSPYVTMEYYKVSPIIRPLSIFDDIMCPKDADITTVISSSTLSTQQPATEAAAAAAHNESQRHARQRQRKLRYGVCYQEDDGGGAGLIMLHGVQFIAQTQEGLNWMIFASEPISLVMDVRTRREIYSPSPFSGVLRLALMPPDGPQKESSTSSSSSSSTSSQTSSSTSTSKANETIVQIAKSTGLQRLIYHAGVYPISGDVSWAFGSPSSSSSTASDNLAVRVVSGLTGAAASTTRANKLGQPATTATSTTAAKASTTSSSTTATTTATAASSSSSSSSSTTSSSSSSSFPPPPSSLGGGSSNSNRVGTISFKFTTRSFTPTTTTTAPIPLLMLALPHHAELLPRNVQLDHKSFDTTFSCIKGQLTPVLGSTWTYDEPLLSLGFDGDKGSSSSGIGSSTSSSSSSTASSSTSSSTGQSQRRLAEKSSSSSGSSSRSASKKAHPKEQWRDPAVIRIILDNIKVDAKLALPTRTENIYGFGKQAARLAQLAHIANVLRPSNDTTTTKTLQENSTVTTTMDPELVRELAQVSHEILDNLYSSLSYLLSGNVSDSLVYDANLGGMVSLDGLMDSNADFGNGRYNDHHFHYGYILYACAIMGKLRASFIDEFGDHVDAIFFDVAHNANVNSHDPTSGAFFPAARHKMWYDGHSFASGLFPFGNGKSQESSSEAVNCYYGAYLWSAVRHGSASHPESDVSMQTDFARLLLAMEIRGAKTYWHMLPRNEGSNQTLRPTIYSDEFAKNYMVGNLGMLDAVCSTWFRTETLYVHLINFLPVTAATGELFNKDYVSVVYDKEFGPHTEVEMAWRGYVVAYHAIVDPNAAWEEAQSLFSPELDTAASKSQILYWIATRNGFNVSSLNLPTPTAAPGPTSHASSKNSSDSSSSSSSSSSSASCSSNHGCTKIGLVGECCPTSDGIFLGCCSR